ncbi:MAG: DUF4097 family beta strand repeat protein [Clostridia bacterium]|nr:DUF4097 family beta strand repeat protein [Clostridia bacterium]
MRTAVKIWLTVATVLFLISGILFVGVMTVLNWDFTKLSTTKYETNRYTLSETFSDISIRTDTAQVELVPAEGSESTVVCYEEAKRKHEVAVEDGVLVIKVVDTRAWYEYIGIHFGKPPKLTVAIPEGAYGTLSVKGKTGDTRISSAFHFESIAISTSTGDVTNHASALGDVTLTASTGDILTEGIAAASLQLSVSTGKITVSDVTCAGDLTVNVSTGKATLTSVACKNLRSDGDTGKLILKNVIASEAFSVKRSTGDVTLEACDAAELRIQTDTGDVEGTLLSDKVFLVRTDTGKTEVPSSVTGGKCEITTDTGDIRIRIQPNN